MVAPRTNSHPNYIGNGSLRAAFSERLDLTTLGTDADQLDCLYISYNPEVPPGGTPAVTPRGATVAVSQTGAGANNARITLAVQNHNASGAANSDVSFTIDLDGTVRTTGWTSGNSTAHSIKDIIDLINKDDAGGTNGNLLCGFHAWIGPGGMYDISVQRTALMWQTLAATEILAPSVTGTPTSFLKRDAAVDTIDSDYFSYWRLGQPEVRDRGLFKLLDLYGAIGTDTGATVYIVRDDEEDFVEPTGTWGTDIANHEEVASIAAASLPAGAGGANWLEHNPHFAPPQRGPLVVIVKGDTGDAQTINLVAKMQVEC